jgi:hypothetical protein
MEPFSAGLAVAGATALVNAMVTDGWEGARKKIAKLFGRGDKERTDDTLDRLDRTHTELTQLSGDGLEQARQQQVLAWQTRLGDLLGKYPGAKDELSQIVSEIGARDIGTDSMIQQNIHVQDQAQAAVLGTGVQKVVFSDNKPRR